MQPKRQPANVIRQAPRGQNYLTACRKPAGKKKLVSSFAGDGAPETYAGREHKIIVRAPNGKRWGRRKWPTKGTPPEGTKKNRNAPTPTPDWGSSSNDRNLMNVVVPKSHAPEPVTQKSRSWWPSIRGQLAP